MKLLGTFFQENVVVFEKARGVLLFVNVYGESVEVRHTLGSFIKQLDEPFSPQRDSKNRIRALKILDNLEGEDKERLNKKIEKYEMEMEGLSDNNQDDIVFNDYIDGEKKDMEDWLYMMENDFKYVISFRSSKCVYEGIEGKYVVVFPNNRWEVTNNWIGFMEDSSVEFDSDYLDYAESVIKENKEKIVSELVNNISRDNEAIEAMNQILQRVKNMH